MKRVWTTRGMFVPLVLLIVASLVFVGRGANQTEASPFAPTLTTALGSTAPSTDANVTTSLSFGNLPSPTRNFPGTFSSFTPGDWGMSTDATFANGTITGSLTATTTLGILNSACAVNLPTPIPALLDSSADSSAGNTIAVTAAFGSLIADVDSGSSFGPYPNGGNGVPDGVDRWHTLLSALGLPPARERQANSIVVLGTAVWVDIVTYDPGVIAPASLGFATLLIIENFNPAAPASPGLITDTCGLSTSITQLGTVGGVPHRTNPAAPGQKLFFLTSGGERDADQGSSQAASEPIILAPSPPLPPNVIGITNDDDTCPYNPNLGSPYQPVAPFDGNTTAEAPTDAIDAACDPDGVFSGSDVDFDSYLNRQDNCPFMANGPLGSNQVDVSEAGGPPDASGNETGPQPVDGGPVNDDIGDDCDLNLAVPDGHYHKSLKVSAQCIGAPDGDADGYCDATETALGSGGAGSTPEHLSIPSSCSDGADNDGDAATDLADTSCQLPAHDLSIKKLTGNTVVACAGATVGYNLLLNNAGAADSAEVSIYLNSQPGGTVPPTPGKSPASVVAGSVIGGTNAVIVTSSGPVNVDGDIDVEWLAKVQVPIVKHNPATTTIQFSVDYPAAPCVAGPDVAMTVDVCHGNDIAPLGVGPLNFDCAGAASSDGGQDTNTGNDIISKSIDAQ